MKKVATLAMLVVVLVAFTGCSSGMWMSKQNYLERTNQEMAKESKKNTRKAVSVAKEQVSNVVDSAPQTLETVKNAAKGHVPESSGSVWTTLKEVFGPWIEVIISGFSSFASAAKSAVGY